MRDDEEAQHRTPLPASAAPEWPSRPLAYATPEQTRRPSTREVVFACFTLATGAGYGMAALGIVAGLVDAYLWRGGGSSLDTFSVLVSLVLALASFGVVRASWRIIRGVPVEFRPLGGSFESNSRVGTSTLLVAFLQLVIGSTAAAICAFQLLDFPHRWSSQTLGGLGASLLAIFTGALVVRLKL